MGSAANIEGHGEDIAHYPTDSTGRCHEKRRSEIDWSSILETGGDEDANRDDGESSLSTVRKWREQRGNVATPGLLVLHAV